MWKIYQLIFIFFILRWKFFQIFFIESWKFNIFFKFFASNHFIGFIKIQWYHLNSENISNLKNHSQLVTTFQYRQRVRRIEPSWLWFFEMLIFSLFKWYQFILWDFIKWLKSKNFKIPFYFWDSIKNLVIFHLSMKKLNMSWYIFQNHSFSL